MPDHRRMLYPLIAIALGMLMLAYASVPLYRVFCQVTGFGGTTRQFTSAPAAMGTHLLTVRFNADVAPDLPWAFAPVERSVNVKPGQNRLVAFRATNHSDQPITGYATYNVTPFAAGPYFNKIQCFCFERQTIQPHETVNMPVSFFVDPAMFSDREARGITNITLSYTFFRYEKRVVSRQSPVTSD